MKVNLINEYKDRFKEILKSADHLEHAFYFHIIENWKANWNIEGKDFSNIYEASLQSKVSGRLWGGSRNSAKSMMITLINQNEDFMRPCFRDLFNETLDLGLRLDRFGYHADQILGPMMGKNPKLSTHFHNDRSILCLYLALEYPDRYCLFDYPTFYIMMEKFESRNIPTKVEVERYYKSCRGIFKLITRDEEFVNLIKKLAKQEKIELMLMSIFMEFVAEN
jgi:hypothetical protein